MLQFQGRPREIGTQCGEALADSIQRNLNVLVRGEGFIRPGDAGLPAWIKLHEALIARNWPWLLDEMDAVASAVGAPYGDILLLNLRAWQHVYYGVSPQGGCSGLAITLRDGSIACAAALDDDIEHYCGPVRYDPDLGHSFIAFPLAGTSWGSSGMNSSGLAVAAGSQLLPGLKRHYSAVNQDLAMRVILQSCSTAGQVRDFCNAHPFTTNILCVDSAGGVFCAHHTAAGMLELEPEDGFLVLTNHITTDEFTQWLRERGVADFPEHPTSRARRDSLLRFAREQSGKCDAEDVRRFLTARDDSAPGSVHNRNTIYLTFCDPQGDPGRLWIMRPREPDLDTDFAVHEV